MTSIDTIYQQTAFVLNKAQSGNITPERFNLAANMANRALFKRYEGIPELIDIGQPAMAFSESTDIEKVLSIFKQPVTLYIDNTGFTNKPSDFIRESILTYITQKNGVTVYNSVKICNDQEFQESLTSYLVPATFDNPTCVFRGTKIQFAPVNLVNVQMIYLRMPVTPVWRFTTTSGRPVYDPITSVDCEFPEDIIDDFIMLVIQFMGVSMQRDDVVAYSEQFKQNGQ